MGAPIVYGRQGGVRPIRLMIVDDSIVARSVFATILAPLPAFSIVGNAGTAEQALAALDEKPVDIVLLDLAMPGMDGLSALPEIIRRGQGARVLVVSASAAEGAEACVRAMTLGAADTLEKPSIGGFNGVFQAELIEKLRRIGLESRAPVDPADARAVLPEPPPTQDEPLRAEIAGAVDCIAIGASTGGLHALSALFRSLPPDLSAPILVTQHLPASFMPYFAAQMAAIAGRPADIARSGEPLKRGAVLIAPGDAHLCVRPGAGGARVVLDRTPALSGCMPSVDPMFASMADTFGAHAFAIVLSGMGRDGAAGAARIVAAGGEVAAQDRASSVVWGMPGATARAGLASTVAHPGAIAERLGRRVRASGSRAPSWK